MNTSTLEHLGEREPGIFVGVILVHNMNKITQRTYIQHVGRITLYLSLQVAFSCHVAKTIIKAGFIVKEKSPFFYLFFSTDLKTVLFLF